MLPEWLNNRSSHWVSDMNLCDIIGDDLATELLLKENKLGISVTFFKKIIRKLFNYSKIINVEFKSLDCKSREQFNTNIHR